LSDKVNYTRWAGVIRRKVATCEILNELLEKVCLLTGLRGVEIHSEQQIRCNSYNHMGYVAGNEWIAITRR
jgi:hypothetical protein